MRALAALSRFVGNTFAYWVLIFAVLAFLEPAWFIGLKGFIVPLLGLVMFGMGLTLKLEDFAEVARHNEDWEKSREKASSRLFPYVSLKAHPWIPDDEMPFICCAGVVRRGLCAGGGICLSGGTGMDFQIWRCGEGQFPFLHRGRGSSENRAKACGNSVNPSG